MSEVDARPPPALAKYNGEKPPAPAWFAEALSVSHDDGEVVVDGASIVWRAWGERGAPGLILVHGGLAHLSWWDFIAPYFSTTRRVVAFSLSGMGDSGWREGYGLDLHAAEAIEAGKAGGAFENAAKPVLLGHSFGAFVTMRAGGLFGDQLSGAVMCDAAMSPAAMRELNAPSRRGGRIYPAMADALARFRLLPPQDCDNDYVVDHVARTALKPTEGGQTWKHDPKFWLKFDLQRPDPMKAIADMQCPFAVARGANSALVDDVTWSKMRAVLPASVPLVSVPEAAHHMMLDQPLAFIAAMDALLSSWPEIAVTA